MHCQDCVINIGCLRVFWSVHEIILAIYLSRLEVPIGRAGLVVLILKTIDQSVYWHISRQI